MLCLMHEIGGSHTMAQISSAMPRKIFHQAIILPCNAVSLARASSAPPRIIIRQTTFVSLVSTSPCTPWMPASSPNGTPLPCLLSHYFTKNSASAGLGRFRAGSFAKSAYEQQNFVRRFETGSDFPRPPLIPFQKELTNCIHLIGHVGKEPDIKYFDSGKMCARSSIAVRKTSKSDDSPNWFALEFWNDLAEIAAHHLKKGEIIHVSGVVVVDKFEKDQHPVTIVKVVVREVNYISAPTEVPSEKRMSREERASEKEKLWQEVLENPSEWWDNRTKKTNEKYPDFKHKASGVALWIDSAPQWVISQLEMLDTKKGLGRRSSTTVSSLPY